MFDQFDNTKFENVGRPRAFNLSKYIDVIHMLINCDEVTKALAMIDGMPGWYRDNEPIEITALRKMLYKKLYTPVDYVTKFRFGDPADLLPYNYPRAHITYQIIKEYNDKGVYPGLYDVGCGNTWLCEALKMRNLQLDYHGADIVLEDDSSKNIQSPWIFTCFEMLEHLHEPKEIRHYMEQIDEKPEFILLSTPLYCYNGGHIDWTTMDLGHLRTYTPKEFTDYAIDNFPGYSWQHIRHHTQILIGTLPGVTWSGVINTKEIENAGQKES